MFGRFKLRQERVIWGTSLSPRCQYWPGRPIVVTKLVPGMCRSGTLPTWTGSKDKAIHPLGQYLTELWCHTSSALFSYRDSLSLQLGPAPRQAGALYHWPTGYGATLKQSGLSTRLAFTTTSTDQHGRAESGHWKNSIQPPKLWRRIHFEEWQRWSASIRGGKPRKACSSAKKSSCSDDQVRWPRWPLELPELMNFLVSVVLSEPVSNLH